MCNFCTRSFSDTMSAHITSDRPMTEDVYTKCACSFRLFLCALCMSMSILFFRCESGRHQQQQSVSCFVAVGSIVDAVRRVYDTSLHMKSTSNERYSAGDDDDDDDIGDVQYVYVECGAFRCRLGGEITIFGSGTNRQPTSARTLTGLPCGTSCAIECRRKYGSRWKRFPLQVETIQNRNHRSTCNRME